MTMHPPASASPFVHEAFVYDGLDAFTRTLHPFLREGARAGEPALALVSAEKIDRLRAALGADARHVEFADMRQVGANPACIIPVWRDFVDRHADGGRRMRGIGEPVWAGRSAAEMAECRRHEELINVAFDGAPMWLVCPYDRGTLTPDDVRAAHGNHPHVRDGATLAEGRDYRGAHAISPVFDAPLEEPPEVLEEATFTADSLASLRRAVTRQAARERVAPARIGDLTLAVAEVATNSVRHGGGGGTLRIWRDPDALVCEVRDDGVIGEPLAGRLRPKASDDARGLWLVHRLCDLVEIRSSAGGTTVRMHVRRQR